MDFYDFSKAEIAAVKKRFPKLNYTNPGAWKGILEFDSAYHEYRIIDKYEVIIIVPSDYPARMPFVSETGGRIPFIANKYRLKDIRDIHWTKENGACLCVRQEEKIKLPPGSNLVYFLENLVVPYFYGLSFFEERGRWPWREYSHGGLGLLEYYAEDPLEQTKESIEKLTPIFTGDKENWKKYRAQLMSPSANKICICGSKQPFSDCRHGLAWRGLVRLHQDLKRLGLNPYKVFSSSKGKK